MIAILSDIHANLDALEAVLADLESTAARAIVCLGDTVGYGPEPAECLRIVSSRCAAMVLGNHEAMLNVLDLLEASEVAPEVHAPLTLAREQMDQGLVDWLHHCPLVADIDPIVGVHGSLHEPASFPYIFTAGDAANNFARQSQWHVSFHGHSHRPCIWRADGLVRGPASSPVRLSAQTKYSVNVGSVGQPRDGDPRACYVLYDVKERVLCHRRVNYDVEKAQERFRKAGLPEQNRLRIRAGK
jgi:predicted phosphodiesterase